MRADQRRDAKPQCSDVLPPATGRPPRERNTRPVALPSRAAADLRVEDAPSAASGIRPVTACHVRLSLSSVCVDVTATVQVSAGHQPVLGKSAPGGKGGEAVAKGWRSGGEGVAKEWRRGGGCAAPTSALSARGTGDEGACTREAIRTVRVKQHVVLERTCSGGVQWGGASGGCKWGVSRKRVT